MAKQTENLRLKGTVNGLCFYNLDGTYYVRKKSSLTSKRVRTNPAFINTMKSANELGCASVIASVIYKTLPKENRHVALFRKLTGIAKVLLKDGVANEVIHGVLKNYAFSLYGCF